MKPHNLIYGVLILSVLIGLTLFYVADQPFPDEMWWIVAILLYGFGDSLTTALAVKKENVKEAIPASRYLFGEDPKLKHMIFFKFGLFAGALIFYYVFLLDNPFRKLAPVGIAISGAFAVVWNSYAWYSG